MRKINRSHERFLITTVLLVVVLININGQAPMPDALLKSPIQEQLTFIQQRTKIFDNYRAIREDMFQKLIGNVSDTLKVAYSSINKLNTNVSALNNKIDSLSSDLQTTKTSLEDVTRTKNSIRLLGIEVTKLIYNTIMWLIIAGMAALLVLGFIVFRRNITVTHELKKELNELKDEFQVYRKSAREAREKMSMDHFNELKKLRGG
jgi:archaellum component FlaC